MSEFLAPAELAEMLDVPVRTVYKMNTEGTGPPRYRIGKHIRYKRSECSAWIESRRVDPGRKTPLTLVRRAS